MNVYIGLYLVEGSASEWHPTRSLAAKVVEGAATPLDRVYSQDPPAGTKVPRGSTVTIRII